MYCLVYARTTIDHTLPLIVKDNFHDTNQTKPLQRRNHATKWLDTDISRVTPIACIDWSAILFWLRQPCLLRNMVKFVFLKGWSSVKNIYKHLRHHICLPQISAHTHSAVSVVLPVLPSVQHVLYLRNQQCER